MTISEGVATRETGKLPSWLKGVNQVVMALQRLGFVVGSMRVLAVPGRRSGIYRSNSRFAPDSRWPPLHRGWAGRCGLGAQRSCRRSRHAPSRANRGACLPGRAPGRGSCPDPARVSPTDSAGRPVLHPALRSQRRPGTVRGFGENVPGLPCRAAITRVMGEYSLRSWCQGVRVSGCQGDRTNDPDTL